MTRMSRMTAVEVLGCVEELSDGRLGGRRCGSGKRSNSASRRDGRGRRVRPLATQPPLRLLQISPRVDPFGIQLDGARELLGRLP